LGKGAKKRVNGRKKEKRKEGKEKKKVRRLNLGGKRHVAS